MSMQPATYTSADEIKQFILPYSMWDLIRADYERLYGEMPSPHKAQIVVETVNDRVSCFFALQHAIVAGPIHTYPEVRNQGAAVRVAQFADSLFEGKGVTILIATENPRIGEIAGELGFEPVPGQLYAKEVE